ncbi:HK97 family phage prohead protease [Mesorhizobium abyssinicae]|uniref:HK97 family phage prohead protease n=1 Tax=Mesorhizobium abyssinicae TaxID=1209958 RepID=UPI003CEDAC53
MTKAFANDPDVLALWNHNYDRPLGRTSSGTLDLRSDRVGLYFGLNPDDTTPDGMTAIGTVRRQDVSGCSFGFTVTRETWDDGDDAQLPLRIIEEAVLWEVSLCPDPAYNETSASLTRSETSMDNAAAARRRVIQKIERDHRLRGIN